MMSCWSTARRNTNISTRIWPETAQCDCMHLILSSAILIVRFAKFALIIGYLKLPSCTTCLLQATLVPEWPVRTCPRLHSTAAGLCCCLSTGLTGVHRVHAALVALRNRIILFCTTQPKEQEINWRKNLKESSAFPINWVWCSFSSTACQEESWKIEVLLDRKQHTPPAHWQTCRNSETW